MIGQTPPIYSVDELMKYAAYLALQGEDKTISNAGVAISPDTPVTYITTDGDSNLDNATLAAAKVDGTVKIVIGSVFGNAADSWKITPSALVGGSIITFTAVGLGCILVYSKTLSKWLIVANNGGTIS